MKYEYHLSWKRDIFCVVSERLWQTLVFLVEQITDRSSQIRLQAFLEIVKMNNLCGRTGNLLIALLSQRKEEKQPPDDSRWHIM